MVLDWQHNYKLRSFGDVNGDGQTEIVTGGSYFDGSRQVAQLCVGMVCSLALENVKTWYWTSNTAINSVAIWAMLMVMAKLKLLRADTTMMVLRNIAQLVDWNGANLAFEN